MGGAPEGFDARLVLAEAEKSGGAVCHIARDDRRLAQMRDSLRIFAPEMPVFLFPGWDCLPFDRVSPNPDISAARMATLAALTHAMPSRYVLLTTMSAATQRVPARDVLREAAFTARVGNRVDEQALRNFLVRMGFSQAPTVLEPGDYAIRGGIIDIFPPGEGGPVRLDLFGDVLDGARRFDAATQRTTEKLDVVELAPVSEVILDEAAITRFRQNYRIEFGAAGSDDPLYEAVSAGRKQQGMEHWLPFFHERLETLFDYLPGVPVTQDDQITAARLSRWDGIVDQYETRKVALSQKSRMDTVYKPVPPDQLYLDDAAWIKALGDRRVVQFHPLPQASGPGVVDAGGRIGRNFSPERQQENISLFSALADHVRKKMMDGPVLIASYSEGARERLTGLIEDEGLAEAIPVNNATRVGKRGLHLTVWPLEHGFEAPWGVVGKDARITVISEQDVLGDRLIRSPKKRRKAENFLTETQSLSPGDLVVHVDHGIGRYLGMEVITAAGAAHECLLLEYAERSRLYLPVENIELLSRYGHDELRISHERRVAGQESQAQGAYPRDGGQAHPRGGRTCLAQGPDHGPATGRVGFVFRPVPVSGNRRSVACHRRRDGRHAFWPTDGPVSICGDVGFGKTEVAMRAAFVAAMSGVQVAVIAPTTLLARQHYKSFAERFRGFPLEVRPLSRFVSTKDAQATKDGMARGTVDIVVGTHALLADERQVPAARPGDHRRGTTLSACARRKRSRQLRAEVHVLTLTATPIPRTLQHVAVRCA